MATTTTADFLQLAYVIRLTRTCQLVPSTLLVYDYVISIDREIEYIWNRPRTTTTILYLIVRYFGTVYGLINTAVFLSNVSGEVRVT
ncbi:hypothetical protein EV401DRAFT_973233 [Pisolithus croceorrhizus]|nr:hypothetical protein EV401DRAFT_973233 [Pisolithus croceorrhizus]